jgi:hypothetical protein
MTAISAAPVEHHNQRFGPASNLPWLANRRLPEMTALPPVTKGSGFDKNA